MHRRRGGLFHYARCGLGCGFKLAVVLLLIASAGCAAGGEGIPVPGEDRTARNADRQNQAENSHDALHVRRPNDESPTDERNIRTTQPESPFPPNTTPARLHAKAPQTESVEKEQRRSQPPVPRENVKGIYVSGHAAASKTKMEALIKLLDQTELNAVVLDIKNDFGRITYDSNVPLARETGADAKPLIRDVTGLLERLKRKNIYVIGRIVAFKDPHLAKARADLALQRKDGSGIWRDQKGAGWLDPYVEEAVQYNLALAKEAAKFGFDEIQFDYVRFPDNGLRADAEIRYRNRGGIGKAEQIGRFLDAARRELHPLGVPVSADVFGLTTTARDDLGIGQEWERIAASADIICPMVYPSHYATGSYGIRHPDLHPGAVVAKAIKDGLARNARMDGQSAAAGRPAAIRPWLQAFTAKWLKPHKVYGKAEIEAQIEAARSLGIESYLLWDPACRYAPLLSEGRPEGRP